MTGETARRTGARSRHLRVARPEPATEDAAGKQQVCETVDLRPLKLAVGRLALRHPLRDVVLSEPDTVPFGEYAAKVLVWIKLLHFGEDRE